MKCNRCRYGDTRVVRTESKDDGRNILRRRECLKCGNRFTTLEDLRDKVDGFAVKV